MTMQGQYDPLPREAPPPPRMDGFGSAGISTPLFYGSVNDGRMRTENLEQKLKKQYWKTKQTFIQKLGKNQDEFVVAGDVEIDMKLEKAYHLRSTSIGLLQAISKYSSKIKHLSHEEETMGRYLMKWSETEYTNAGEIMKNVGKMQENDSQARLGMLPSLARLRSECGVFQTTAIRDLNVSIERLEKARTDYRAALLWMKDVSDKLHNPDYHNQLTKYREAQVTVKDSKLRFDKLKNDLSEKIDMVFASRCNLLSRSLPFYQKELLSFCDKSANAFHKILVDLRSHHHHQYKVKRLLEEIRDLESEETPLAPEMELPADDDDDEPLLDIGADVFGEASLTSPSPTLTGENVATVQDGGVLPQREVDPFSFERILEEAGVSDMQLGGSGASIQSELKQPNTTANGENTTRPLNPEPAQPTTEEPSLDEIDNLLNFEETLDKTQTEQAKEEVLDEWGSFSAFMSSDQKETDNPHSGWEKEFTASKQDSGIPDLPVDTPQQQLSSKDKMPSTSEPNILPLLGDEDVLSNLLSDDLKLLGLTSLEPTKQQGQLSSGLESLDPLMFQASQPQSPVPLPTASPSLPPLMPQPPSVFRSPLAASQSPILPPTYLRQGEATKGAMKGGASPKKAVKKDDGKGSAWMNVFAHLDPLANEKA